MDLEVTESRTPISPGDSFVKYIYPVSVHYIRVSWKVLDYHERGWCFLLLRGAIFNKTYGTHKNLYVSTSIS